MNISEANAVSRVLRYLTANTTATPEVKEAARHLANRSYSALMAGVTPADIDKWASVDDLLNEEKERVAAGGSYLRRGDDPEVVYVHIHQRGDTVVAVQRSLYDRGEAADLLHEDADDDRTVVYTLLGDAQ